jgi:hypothetical protein
LIKIPVEKAGHPHNCCQEEHLSVIAQPSEIDPNLLSIVLPEEKEIIFRTHR